MHHKVDKYFQEQKETILDFLYFSLNACSTAYDPWRSKLLTYLESWMFVDTLEKKVFKNAVKFDKVMFDVREQ